MKRQSRARIAGLLAAIPLLLAAAHPCVAQRYDIGQPTDTEQLLVEMMNRARADARAEAQRLYQATDPDVLNETSYFHVDMDLMTNQFETLPRTLPPLSIRSNLTAAARLHSMDLFINVFQGHYSSSTPPPPNQPGDNPGQRAERQGYVIGALGENVYSYAKTPFHAHAGFNIDWNGSANEVAGMLSPPSHRLNIHSSVYKEIGVGVVEGSNSSGGTTVGPLLVTQDFGTPNPALTYITGVAYADLNSNQFYDIGEGLGGVSVSAAGTTWHAVTAESGGYSVPVPGNGSYPVVFSGPGIAATATVSVVNNENVKVDFVLPYATCDISGPTNVVTGATNTYALTTVPGATTYYVRQAMIDDAAWLEGAEGGTSNLLVDGSAGYNVVQSAVKVTGAAAFQLVHPTNAQGYTRSQTIELDRSLWLHDGAQLQFASRIRYATATEVAYVQVAAEGDTVWQDVYRQEGSGGSGEGSFSIKTVDLNAYAGLAVRLRFVFAAEGSFYIFDPALAAHFGWFVDDISVRNCEQLLDMETVGLGGNQAYAFTPPVDGRWLLETTSGNGANIWPFGGALVVESSAPPVRIEATSIARVNGGSNLDMEFRCDSPAGLRFSVETTTSLSEPFTPVGLVGYTDLGGGMHRVRFSTPSGPRAFFRVVGVPTTP